MTWYVLPADYIQPNQPCTERAVIHEFPIDLETGKMTFGLTNRVQETPDPTRTVTFFFATKTHFIKVMESYPNYKVPAKVECFPIPTVHEAPESYVLYHSYRGRAAHGLNLRERAVIHEFQMDLETGKMSLVLCGLRQFSLALVSSGLRSWRLP